MGNIGNLPITFECINKLVAKRNLAEGIQYSMNYVPMANLTSRFQKGEQSDSLALNQGKVRKNFPCFYSSQSEDC